MPRSTTRRDEIVSAALRCFTRDGYDAASIENICAESGASVGSVYHHFGSKEGIAAAVYAEGIRRYQEGLLAILRAGGDPDRVVRDMARHHLTWSRRNRDWAHFLLQRGHAPAAVTARPEVHQLNAELLKLVTDWAAPHTARGRIVDVPPLVLLGLVLGPGHAIARAWLAGLVRLDDRTVEQVSAAAARSIVPGRAPQRRSHPKEEP